MNRTPAAACLLGVLLGGAALGGGSPRPAGNAGEPLFREEFVAPLDPRRPFCHAPTITETGDGDLLAAWYAGSREMAPDVAILAARRPRGTDHWGAPEIAADEPRRSEGNPVLFIDPGGAVRLFYVTLYGADWRSAKVKSRRSADGGRTWGEERVLRDEPGFMTGNKPARLRGGTVLLPLYDERSWSSVILESRDGGTIWSEAARIASDPGNIQASIAQLRDGSLLALMRCGGRGQHFLWQTTSSDDGRTWSRPVQSALRNPNSRADLVRLADGHLVVAFNDAFEGRTPLSVALSTDEGRSWAVRRTVEEGPGDYAYPAIIEGRDGLIHLVYAWRRSRIKQVEFNEAWLADPPPRP